MISDTASSSLQTDVSVQVLGDSGHGISDLVKICAMGGSASNTTDFEKHTKLDKTDYAPRVTNIGRYIGFVNIATRIGTAGLGQRLQTTSNSAGFERGDYIGQYAKIIIIKTWRDNFWDFGQICRHNIPKESKAMPAEGNITLGP